MTEIDLLRDDKAPEPAAVFWEKVIAPANIKLLEGDERARLLSKDELKQYKHKLAVAKEAIANWDWQQYENRAKKLQHKIHLQIKQLAKLDDELEAANLDKQIRALEDKLQDLHEQRPAKPELPIFEKIRRRWAKYHVPQITSKTQAKKVRLYIHRLQQRLDEHQIAVENKELYDELANDMLMEVKFFGEQIVKRWSSLGERDEVFIKGNRKVKLVKIEEAHYTEDEIQYKIKVSSRTALGSVQHHLPNNVRAWNLVKPEALMELEVACQRPVSSPHTSDDPQNFEYGAWVTVHREGLRDGLFDQIELNQVMVKYNQALRYRFPVPVGIKRGRMVEWMYLDTTPHMLFAGQTGAGKTNAMIAALSTWIQYHAPTEIRFYIVDLKKDGKFMRFANIPHLAAPIIHDVDRLEQLIPQLVHLMKSRMNTIAAIGASDIADYNKRVDANDQMERIVVMVDESASITNWADSQSRRNIWNGFTLLSIQARASGIHLMFGTQQTSKETMPSSVRDNITFVLCGKQRTHYASIVILRDGRAADLPSIRGRMWCDNNGDWELVQSPLVTERDMNQAISVAMNYGTTKPLAMPELSENEAAELVTVQRLTPFDIATISVDTFDGVMSAQKIYEVTEGTPRSKIAELISKVVSMGEIQVYEEWYDVKPYGKGYHLVLRDNAETLESDTYPNGVTDGFSDDLQVELEM